MSRVAYSTSTGAATPEQREQARQRRIQFVTGRNAALGAQRDVAIKRLAKVRGEVRSIHASILASDTLSDAAKIEQILVRHAETEAKLVADIDRLAAKMGA